MTPYKLDARAWQESWDRQQEAYLPDREHRFTAMLDVVDAVAADGPLRLLDLAGGTGSISLRALARFEDAEVTLLDLDPALLAIAAASLGSRVTVVTADLRSPGWVGQLPHRSYDAVLTATALHWLAPERLTALYSELPGILRPGGVFVNADHMPDAALPALSRRLIERADARREARYAAGAVLPWRAWWDRAATDPLLAPLVEERNQIYPKSHSSTEWTPPAAWHLDALAAAGFTETGIVWRGGADAAVAGVR
ncbi:class I SAM-dependent methyltransferase [Dactylosporangium sucinum]|uniref:Methyltransferase n=1 Tax=Dactylosporangium sucinum TaxID=1424081 RepID=A0A917WMA2_9ACTN|nr:class I SAM-dependent methyltransferase [Dactylosporangium sucinum]GGM14877.1 methyltransferase [Dactylosporangium sucinum]